MDLQSGALRIASRVKRLTGRWLPASRAGGAAGLALALALGAAPPAVGNKAPFHLHPLGSAHADVQLTRFVDLWIDSRLGSRSPAEGYPAPGAAGVVNGNVDNGLRDTRGPTEGEGREKR